MTKLSTSLAILQESSGIPEHWRAIFEQSPSSTCVINADHTIVYCNPAWDSFALQNNGELATSSHVEGQNLLDYIPSVLHPYYRKLIATTMEEQKVTGRDYTCHSEDAFRMYRLVLIPIPATKLLAMEHTQRIARPMDLRPVDYLGYRDGTGHVVTMCAQCRRTKGTQASQWDWVPEFVRNPPPRVSHGICPDCLVQLQL
jgi:PAS domain-containing protein